MAAIAVKREKRASLTNYMEELTGDILDSLISDEKLRFSTGAKADIKALALNRLWPMYTTSAEGKSFLKRVVVEDQVENDILRELRTAMAKVRQHPR